MPRASLVAPTAAVNQNDCRYTSHRYSRYTAIYMAVYGPCKRTGRIDGINGPCAGVHRHVHGVPEADLGMFSMFGRTGPPTKKGPHKRTCEFFAT